MEKTTTELMETISTESTSLKPEDFKIWVNQENPTILAAFFSVLPPNTSQAILKEIKDQETQIIIVRLIAKEQNLSFDVLKYIQEQVQSLKKLKSLRKSDIKIKTPEFIKKLSPKIIEELRKKDPELMEIMERETFDLNQFSMITKNDRSKILGQEKDTVLVALIARESESFVNAALEALSEKRKELLKEELLDFPKMRKEDYQNLKEAFCQKILSMEKEDIINFPWKTPMV